MTDIEEWVRPAIRGLSAYHVPGSDGLLKLDAMENPYSLPEALKKAWLDCLAEVEINRYPDPGATALKQRLRSVFDIPEHSGLILGNGSDELIQMLAALVGGPGRTFIAPAPSFSMYQLISVATGTTFREVPLADGFEADTESFIQVIEETDPACVFIAYPNNPTGNCFHRSMLEKVIATAPGLVVVDEAYHAFCGKTFMQDLLKHRNLLVMRTLSKSGLAGIRLGLMAGHPDWINELEKIRLPYNINSLTQASASFCLDHHSVLEHQASKIRANRQRLFETLNNLPGVTPYPSEANFILIRLDQDATRIFEGLKQRGVLVKNLNQAGTPLQNCLRITVGSTEQNQIFLSALNQALKER